MSPSRLRATERSLALAALSMFLSLPAAGQGQILDARAYFPPCSVGQLERGWVVSGGEASVDPTDPGECVLVNAASARRWLYARCCDESGCTDWVGPARDGKGDCS